MKDAHGDSRPKDRAEEVDHDRLTRIDPVTAVHELEASRGDRRGDPSRDVSERAG